MILAYQGLGGVRIESSLQLYTSGVGFGSLCIAAKGLYVVQKRGDH